MSHCVEKLIFSFITSIIFVSYVNGSREVPSIFKPCDSKDVFVDECLKTSIQSAIVSLSAGLPELKIPPLDPYEQKELTVRYDKYGVAFVASLRDIRSTGLRKVKVTDVRSNIQDNYLELEIDLLTPKVFVEGLLSGDGLIQYQSIIIKAKGDYFNNTVYDVFCKWKLSGKVEMKGGDKYVNIDKFDMKTEVGDMTVHVPDVTYDPELNRLATKYANIYWRNLYDQLIPLVEIAWQKIGLKFSNRIFSKIPYNKLFP